MYRSERVRRRGSWPEFSWSLLLIFYKILSIKSFVLNDGWMTPFISCLTEFLSVCLSVLAFSLTRAGWSIHFLLWKHASTLVSCAKVSKKITGKERRPEGGRLGNKPLIALPITADKGEAEAELIFVLLHYLLQCLLNWIGSQFCLLSAGWEWWFDVLVWPLFL